MTDEDNLLKIDGAENAPISTAHGISAIALNMALKWHDMTLIKDGVMYQQKKMEGVNIEYLEFDRVLETAKQIEAHIMNAPGRLAGLVLDVIETTLNVLESDDEPEAAD